MAIIKSIEEKAKAYDEAIKRLEDIKTGKCPKTFIFTKGLFDYIFPELKESEDDRIRETLIENFKWFCGDYPETTKWGKDDNLLVKDMIAWLEKQGEHAKFRDSIQVGDKVTRNEDGVLVNLSQLKRVAKKDEKQGEQKPQGKTALEAIKEEKVDNANKVEPKFKVGDWISGYYTNYKVLSVNNDGYLVEDVDGNKINILFENEKFHHLFTIADAKEGDVLSWDDSKCITIFKNIYDKDSFNSYGFVGSCTGTFESRIAYHDIKGAHPATREQRDLLFTKMEEAGYEWDARKKELNKVEQKEAIHKELTEFEKAVKQVMEEAIECGDTHNLKADAEMLLSLVHKSAWSEEDEIRIKNILSVLDVQVCWDGATGKKGNPYQKEINWLKSLRPQSQWKPSDEQMRTLEHYTHTLFCTKHKEILFGLYSDLKKLRGE